MSSTDAARDEQRDAATTPAPDDPRKPDSPTDITKRSWFYVVRKTWHEFSEDQCTDLAAALTYYAVLAMFPAMLALVSLLGVVGQGESAVQTVLDTAKPLVSQPVYQLLEDSFTTVAGSQAAGLALVIGLVGAVWSASGYTGAFGRAMNKIYEIEEGRPFWKLRPILLVLTLIALVLTAVALVILVVSGPLLTSIADVVGLGSTAELVWKIAKWPVLAVVVVMIVALLYYATPNVKQPKFRWLSVGAVVAILIWVVASLGFAFYVGQFSSYNKTYGALAGIIVALLWLWITNLALLFGAELDAELERGRQLQAGIAAEEELQLPARDTRNIKKLHRKQEKDAALGRKIRRQAAEARNDDNETAPEQGRKEE